MQSKTKLPIQNFGQPMQPGQLKELKNQKKEEKKKDEDEEMDWDNMNNQNDNDEKQIKEDEEDEIDKLMSQMSGNEKIRKKFADELRSYRDDPDIKLRDVIDFLKSENIETQENLAVLNQVKPRVEKISRSKTKNRNKK